MLWGGGGGGRKMKMRISESMKKERKGQVEREGVEFLKKGLIGRNSK